MKERKFYPSLFAAQEAVRHLDIRSIKDYQRRYKLDPLLPYHPNKIYAAEWTNWPDFFGKDAPSYYPNLEKTKVAAQHLDVMSVKDYQRRCCKIDPLLPYHPDRVYSKQWKSWLDFLGKDKLEYYPNLVTTKKAAQRLKITSQSDYQRRYKLDPLLPCHPNEVYAAEWTNWFDFLGKTKSEIYSSLAEASKAVQKQGIVSKWSYQRLQGYKLDPRLPYSPDKVYKAEWSSWMDFLGQTNPEYYPNLATASEAAKRLGIASGKEYLKRYKSDPLLPCQPYKFYAAEWTNWFDFLGKVKSEHYPNLASAKDAVLRQGITSHTGYQRYYKLDPLLPCQPNLVYAEEWRDWADFLGKPKSEHYSSLAAARNAAQNMGIVSEPDYKKRYKLDPLLPARPNEFYISEWTNWFDFLGKIKPNYYSSLMDASKAAQLLGIKSGKDYLKYYKLDPRLPSTPYKTYSAEWKNWPDFLGKTKPKYYPNLAQARKATNQLGIQSSHDYQKLYKLDPLLPSQPHNEYATEWTNWFDFLGKNKPEYYPSLAEARAALQRLNIVSQRDYQKRYKFDPLLPSTPHQVYAEEWSGFSDFLGKSESIYYLNLAEARKATQSLNIVSQLDYQQRYKLDPLLPFAPNKIYAEEWISWINFLLPTNISTLEAFRVACTVLGIKNSQQYRNARKKHKQIPAKPEKNIPEWTNWYDALDIPRPYQYEELASLVRKNSITSLKQYRKFRIASNDPRIPVKPEEHYQGKGWTNTFDLWGIPRPYQVKYFKEEWHLWAEHIDEFLKSAKGGDTKAKDLCEFVREYIEPQNFEKSPLEFLTRRSTNIQPMLDLFSDVSVNRKKKWLYSINEFLNWILKKYLLLEDTDTGEITPIKGANNPFSHVNFDGEISPQVANETNKLALPYQFVKSGREWIFPANSIDKNLNYKDLAHLHCFPADWVQIDDVSLLDENDPDCVFKVEEGKTLLWLPMYWTFTYSLMQLPARGIQIVYSDSGEADSELAEFKEKNVIWKRNKGELAGLTTKQGMVSKAKSGDFGVHYTSNKTKFDGSGFTIPFMPIDLAYWLIKLRKWQNKYNPINEPTKWLDCKRTNLNEIQLKKKGINCFLFRDYQDKEPGTFSGRLSMRLAAALFFSAKDDITLATYKGLKYSEVIDDLNNNNEIPLSHFKSEYTPHSMRVSLINAYAYEFGIPLEIIMKLVGHSSIIMTIYYTKSDKTGASIRERMAQGDKEATNHAVKTLKAFVEQQRIEECRSQLVGSSVDFLNSLDNSRPASSYLFKDFGVCPVGCAFCSEGGSPVATKANIFHPVPAGYLGEQNCPQCRFFVTGPAFMMGLAALFNEISLNVNTQSFRYTQLEQNLDSVVERIEVISHEIYKLKADDTSNIFLESERKKLVDERFHLNAEIETRAKKLDLYMSDMNAIHRHLYNCQQILNQPESNNDKKLQLVVPHQAQIGFELDDVSNFHQLSEVCENAELYHSCSDELAVTRRSQALDKMMLDNGMQPQFFLLNEQEQLAVGNQLTQLMLTRLKGWENVDKLIDGRVTLKDLSINEQLNEKSILDLFEKSKPIKRIG
ncbi:VPA1269 family protein [Vibrio vulnificus]|nr:VPA1269 family protein [Vibrio vulnificus]